MYTHGRPEALQALPGLWDKEVSDYGAPPGSLWVGPLLVQKLSLHRALVPGAPVFQIRKHKTEFFYAEILKHKSTSEPLGALVQNTAVLIWQV